MVFLILSAQYERWSLPLAVLLALPFGTFGALVAVWARGLTSDVYFQIGLVTLLGLAAKNAILIVEFALNKHRGGPVAHPRRRWRRRACASGPILMTSLAFIFGVLPLALSTGAGAGARHSVGTGVMGGMLAATFLAIFFVPVFFKVIFDRHVTEKRSTKRALRRARARACTRTAARVPPTPGHPPPRHDRRHDHAPQTHLPRGRALALAGCAVTQPIAAANTTCRPPSATAAQNELLEHWWTAVRRSGARPRSWRRRSPTTGTCGSRWRASMPPAPRCCWRSRTCIPSVDLGASAYRSRSSASETLAAAALGHPALSQQLPAAAAGLLRARPVGQVPRRLRWPRRTSSRRRSTTRRRCASRWPPKSRRTYFRLRAADAELAVLRDTLRLRTDTVQLQRDRFEGGLIGEYDLRSAEAERSAVVADIARAENAIGQLESALATLTGRSPRAVFTPVVARGASIEAVTEVPALPAGLALGPARAPARHPARRGAARRLRPADRRKRAPITSRRSP